MKEQNNSIFTNNRTIINGSNISITAESTFADLHNLLKKIGAMATEQEEKAKEADEANERKQEALREAGIEENMISDGEADETASELQKGSRPKPSELAEEEPIVKTEDGRTRVYSNGYALCTAPSSGRDLVIWVPDCRTVRYGFVELEGEIKRDIPDYNTLVFEADTDGDGNPVKVEVTDRVKDATKLPWYMAIEETADNRDDKNFMNRGHDRKGKKVGTDDKVRANGTDNDDVTWADSNQARTHMNQAHFPSGEEIMISRETRKERSIEGRRLMKLLTQKQAEAFYLCNYYDMTEEEAAGVLGIKQQTVHDRIEGARKKIEKNRKNI